MKRRTPFIAGARYALLLGLSCHVAPGHADQYRMAADNARVDCEVSRKELTRISLVGDEFASVSKVSTGTPFNDFSVVNEPVRGDIYVQVPDAYAPSTISFFATSKRGYVYKFVCTMRVAEAQQVFITNPAIATAKARDWEQETSPQDAAVRLIQAMANDATVEGYELRQTSSSPTRVGDLSVRLISEYRGAALLGKVLRIENLGAAPVTLTESELSPAGTLAITIAQGTLAPRQATVAYLVGQNGGR